MKSIVISSTPKGRVVLFPLQLEIRCATKNRSCHVRCVRRSSKISILISWCVVFRNFAILSLRKQKRAIVCTPCNCIFWCLCACSDRYALSWTLCDIMKVLWFLSASLHSPLLPTFSFSPAFITESAEQGAPVLRWKDSGTQRNHKSLSPTF